MPVEDVNYVASLPFGQGKVGLDHHVPDQEKSEFTQDLGSNVRELTKDIVVVDCMDGRRTVRLADGTTDEAFINSRQAGQLAGGAALATTKAAVAADAAYLRGIKTMEEAYALTYDLLLEIGVQDAAHGGCGASKLVHKSVAERLPVADVSETLGALGAPQELTVPVLQSLDSNKDRRLYSGFYDSWTPEFHAEYVISRSMQNFSYLEEAPDDVHGHHEAGVLLVPNGYYFDKNSFIGQTGKQVFALTFGVADRIANSLGESDEERFAMQLAFRDDTFNVANHIVGKGLDVYTASAQ